MNMLRLLVVNINTKTYGGHEKVFTAMSDSPKNGTTPKPTAPRINLKDLPDLLTIREVSEILRVSPLTLKRWGKRGKLQAIRINSRGDRRYKKEAVLWVLGMTE
jgi:excisionase family DNA binding protein